MFLKKFIGFVEVKTVNVHLVKTDKLNEPDSFSQKLINGALLGCSTVKRVSVSPSVLI